MMIRYFKKRHSSFVKPESNETKCDFNDCEAGPSKRPKKDDSSMIKVVNKDLILNSLQSIEKIASKSSREVIMNESFNISTINHGDASNNTIHVVNNFNLTKESTILVKDESSTIVDKTVTTKVSLNNKKILELIWNNRSFDEHCLILEYDSMLQIIPDVSFNYEKIIIRGYRCKTLTKPMREMLKLLSQSVVDLTLDGCEFDLIALIEFLRELPLLNSLKLNVFITMDSIFDLSERDLPNLLKLKDFEIKVNADELNETFDMTGFKSNLESITLFDAIFDNDLIDNLIKYKKSLTSLSLTKCITTKPSYKTNLNSLHFDSSANLSSVDFKRFDCLEKLTKLELIKVNDEMIGILFTKCFRKITNFKMIYNDEQRAEVKNYKKNEYYQKMKKIEMYGSNPESIIECSTPQRKETENLDENSSIFYFKVDHDRADFNQVESHFNVRVKMYCDYKEHLHEYYKIRDVPQNASFSDSDYDVMDEDKLIFDDDSDRYVDMYNDWFYDSDEDSDD